MLKHFKITVTGKVQGVFYRKHTKEKARELGLKGFVMNKPDGSVYIEAEGEEDVIEALLAWCRQGPEMAEVSDVYSEPGSAEGFGGFEVRYTS